MNIFSLHRMISIALVMLLALGGSMRIHGTEQPSPSAARIFRNLRKSYLVNAQLPPARRGYRKEHLEFLRQSTAFIQSLSAEKDADKPYLIATFSLRGNLLFNCGNYRKAREDFDRALNLLPPAPKAGDSAENAESEAPPPANLPLGAMKPGAIRLFRAFTFAESGTESFLQEMKEIPPVENLSGTVSLNSKIRGFAEKLAADGKLDEAIAVYEIIARHHLWDEDRDQDPKRLIEILEVQKQNRSF